MAENFKEIKVIELQGTYLLWLDMRKTGLNHKEMKKLLIENHIYLDNGEMFGEDGRGFQRINLACPRATLEKMLLRFKSGMEKVYAEWEENGRPYHQTLSVGTKLENFTYDSVYGKNRTLPNKKTLIVFSRFLTARLQAPCLSSPPGFIPRSPWRAVI